MTQTQKPENIPAAPGTLRLKGSVSEQMERFFDHRIRSAEARDIIYREAEDAFRNRLDDASGIHGIWQGEFWGKWIISAVRVCEYSRDAELKAFIRRGVHTLITMQEPSGYLGTYHDPMNVFAADPEKTKPVLGWPCNWNWNIWCRKYTLWALLEAWRLLEEPEILTAAGKLARHLIRTLRENGIRLGATGTFAGIPSGSILKPVLILYRATKDGEFLRFAEEIADNWSRNDGLCPNLIANALSGKPVHEWYPEPKEWAKAYEMMSCFDGILELYRITGTPALLESAKRFHALLKNNELNKLFSVGFNDIFANGAGQLNAITEPCDVVHWMRLCHELFLITDDKTCLDDFELAFCNPFLASVYRDGKWGARGVRSHGRHLTVFEQAGMKHNHCCVNNLPRGFMNMAQTAATRSAGTVSVNFYTGFEWEENGSRLTVSGDYLASGDVRIKWEAAEKTVLRFRIPGWATSAELSVNGETQTGSGDWFFRTLPPGKTELRLKFGRKLEIRDHAAQTETDEWYRTRWQEPGMEELFRTARASTLVYGPLLLARSKYIGNTETEMFGAPLPAGFSCSLTPVPSTVVRCAFEADFGGFKTMVCDYASAGNAVLDNQRFFSIFF